MPNVIVVGGGPAGMASAIALAERGVRVRVIDPTGGVPNQRGELLPEAASAIIDRLGLAGFLGVARKIDRVVSHWGAARMQAHGDDPTLGLHGWGIDRKSLAAAMLSRFRAMGGTVQHGRVAKHHRAEARWHLEVGGRSGPATFQADYIIDATGRPARIARRQRAILLNGPDLVGVVWQTNADDQAVMQSEATSEGWWYAVPHRFGQTIGFITSGTRAKAIGKNPADFLMNARKTLKSISVSKVRSPCHILDSRNAVLTKMSGPGWLATGDSASAFDPIASQGLFNALSGGFFAGNAAADVLSGDNDAASVYAVLAARTAERTHQLSHLQYATRPHDTPFWQRFARQANCEGVKILA